MLTPKEAENELRLGAELNPGRWEQHCFHAGRNARKIAEKVKGMDSDKAYVMGLLHDIGRRAGIADILHIFHGYDYMMEIGQPQIARICLTHSYPCKDINSYLGKFDCTAEQLDFLKQYLDQTAYDNYDLLIQLCDVISLPQGACIMEKRFVDVALRHGLPECTLEKWRAYIQIKKHFDQLCGCNIYSLLPDVWEHSCEDLL